MHYLKHLATLTNAGKEYISDEATKKKQGGKMKEAKILFTKTLMNYPDNASAEEGIELIK